MKDLLNTLYNKVKENPEEYFGEYAYARGTNSCYINGFTVTVRHWCPRSLIVVKDGVIIYDDYVESGFIDIFFGNFYKYNKFHKLIEGIENRREKRNKMEEELKESMQEQQKKDFIKNGVDTWIKELEGIEVKQLTKEFDEVIRDTNRLKEISKEAQAIHKKYQKSFFN